MDEYGIAAAAKVGLRIYETASRRSGRTTRLIERVTDEDQIVVPSLDVHRHVEHLLRDAKKKTRVFIVKPSEYPMSRVGTAPKGRTFFDHTWLEQFVLESIEDAERNIESMHRAMSKAWPEKPDPRENRMNEMWMFNR